MSAAFHPGDIVFFKHPKHSWVLGHVQGGGANAWTCKADDVERQCTNEVIDRLADSDVTNCREDLLDETPDDLLSLTVLHDATLLRCLYIRYFRDIIYTNIGAIVVALNPFNFKIPWYQDDKMGDYLKEGSVIEKNLPHSWAQAHNTYNEMMSDASNQCILISGESGAGKTEATKIVMKYLAQISCQRGSAEEKAAGLQVGAKLNSCSPILEAFGNAKTVRNDNSSRFGKFMKVKFSPSGQLIGAHTTKYLLEKSRIVTASEDERVYHSFYLVTRSSYASSFNLEGDAAYKSINAGKCLHNGEYDTLEDFREVAGAMKSIGMRDDEVASIWACTAAILSLLNVTFLKSGEGSAIDPATQRYLDAAVRLFKIDGERLAKELTVSTMVIKGAATQRLLTPVVATDVRDATAKATYNGMFGWLVEKSNELCDTSANVGNWIGLLDIFGFEDFKHNSFEQLCINLANETLQNHYNTYIFEKDMDECRKEGIDVTEVRCPDNSPCLRLITDKSNGILAFLDSECLLGQGTDLNFLEKIDNAQAKAKNPHYFKKKQSRDTFVIHHYAASVEYNVNGWLEKNRDTLKDDIKLIMRQSDDALIKEFLEAPVALENRKGRNLTVGGFFKEQVQMLMEVINSTNPHWIRCVKPHPAKRPKMFDGVQTMNQLESSGVLGTVKIRKAGYPIRTLFAKFKLRYQIIVGAKGRNAKTPRDLAELILVACGMKDKKFAQLGKTKVFMKAEAFPMIERKRNEFLLGHARRLQRAGKGLLARLAANRSYCRKKQADLAALLIEEYRMYLRRSKEIREERARLRREAEVKFRGLRRDAETAAEAAYAALHQELDAFFTSARQETEKRLVLERRRMEMLRVQRDGLVRQEYLARTRLFEEATAHLDRLMQLYVQEVRLFMECELDFVEEREGATRASLTHSEQQSRNALWRSFMRIQSAKRLMDREAAELAVRGLMEELEQLQRKELFERFAVLRRERVMRGHYVKHSKRDAVAAREAFKRRRAFEAYRDEQVFHFDRLRRDELHRLQLNSGAVRRAGGLPMQWEASATDAEPSGCVAPSPSLARCAPDSTAAAEFASRAATSPAAPYANPASHLLHRVNDILRATPAAAAPASWGSPRSTTSAPAAGVSPTVTATPSTQTPSRARRWQ